jgi:lysophospholipase L1-like esterase
MRKTLSAVAAAVTLAAGTLLTGPASGAATVDEPESPPAPTPVRIMIAGDSITQGFDGDYTWRYRLFLEFARQAVPVDFVGSKTAPYGGRGTYLVSGWDSDHSAVGGAALWERDESIGAEVALLRPDVLVALYGTNDLVDGRTPAQLLASWRTYVASARAANPQVKLVLGEVATPKARSRAAANAGLQALATELTNEQSPIVVADLDSPDWVPSRHSRDHTHPNPTGETLIAQKVAQSLLSLGVLPDSPAIARAFVPWDPPLEPVVHRRGHRLSIDWTRARKAYRVHAMRVRVTSIRTGRSRTWAFERKPTHLLTPVLRPGRYRVVLRGSRGTTMSTWGVPVVRRAG